MAESRTSQALYIDPSVSTDDLSEHDLILEIHRNRLLFILYELHSKIVTGCGSFMTTAPSTLSTVIEKNPWLTGKTNKTRILIGNSRNTIVPNSLFNSAQASDYLDFNYTAEEKWVPFTDDLPSQISKNIFAVPYSQFLVISKTWPGSSVCHITTSMIEGLLHDLRDHPSHEKMIACVHNEKMIVLASEGEELTFCNSFEYLTDEDALFYLLVSMDQLGLDPSSTGLYLCGDIDTGSTTHQLIAQYVKNIRMTPLPEILITKSLKNIPGHLFVNLIHGITCVS